MDKSIDQALATYPRREFLPPTAVDSADYDVALGIGFGQTNSQPSTVRAMLKWLQVEPGQTVLDVGSGSGWTTALLSHLVGPDGRVIAVESVPELVEFGRRNCQRLSVKNVEFHQALNELGWPAEAPYVRILVSASAACLPIGLLNQLTPYGRMVIPVMEDIVEVTKDEKGQVFQTAHPGYLFVPLINPGD